MLSAKPHPHRRGQWLVTLTLLLASACGSDAPSNRSVSTLPLGPDLIRGIAVTDLDDGNRSRLRLNDFEKLATHLPGKYRLRQVTVFEKYLGVLRQYNRTRGLEDFRCDGQPLLPWFRITDAVNGYVEVPNRWGVEPAEFETRLLSNDLEFTWRRSAFGRTVHQQYWHYRVYPGPNPVIRLAFRDYPIDRLIVEEGQMRCRAVYLKVLDEKSE